MKKVKVAVLGLGNWGVCHLEAYMDLEQVEVTAICDRREDLLHKLGDKYDIANRFTDSDEMWKRDDIELVSIANFENAHFDPTIKALQSGKHILVEKPITTQLREAEDMWTTAELNGRIIVPGHILRFESQYAGVYQAIQSGEIGKPVSIYLKRARPKALFKQYQRTHTVYELTVHDLDLAIWYANSKVKTVKAYTRNVSGASVPDLLWSCLEFENGIIAIIESSWLVPDEANIGMTDALEIIGEKGTASFELARSGLQIWNEGGRQTPAFNIHIDNGGRTSGALREQLRYITNCIANGEKPSYVSFPDAVEGIRVAEAILQSAESGREIQL